ncbi:nucleotidyl cyclase domain-containing protein [Caldisericum exile]|uniref:GGDEF domain-containing protein n=1 Tax=Caldisericum exile (strain DSM 21853 / NBRC 104410 / AZM16c01) TaxID=511051 RepID=A0A7U6GFU3_CALEA|nr:hypothetical protein [Caldisericum exile]BAL81628.1 hypothetical protein CSE_15020 [Caldisericum exile AZM16c01]
MKKYFLYLNFGILPILMLLFMYLFVTVVPNYLKIYFLIFIVALAILTFFEGHLRSFVYLIAGTLTIGFYFVILTWGKLYVNQLNFITSQTLLILLSVIIWIESIYFKRILDENEYLLKRVQELEKFVGNTRVLTRSEFLDTAKIFIKSSKRRGEKLGLLIFKLKSFDEKVPTSIIETMGKVISETVRSEFDAVGLIRRDTLAVLLQNTNFDGINAVFERIKQNLSKTPNIYPEEILNIFDVEKKEFGKDFEDLLSFLEEV